MFHVPFFKFTVESLLNEESEDPVEECSILPPCGDPESTHRGTDIASFPASTTTIVACSTNNTLFVLQATIAVVEDWERG